MRLSIICFAFGVALLQLQPSLLALGVLFWLAILAVCLLLTGLLFQWRCSVRQAAPGLRLLVPVAAFLLGFCWAAGMAQWRLADALTAADEGQDIPLVGYINAMPQPFENGVRFNFLVEGVEDVEAGRDVAAAELDADAAINAVNTENLQRRVPRQLTLSWYLPWQRQAKGRAAEQTTDLPQLQVGQRWRLTVRLKRPHGSINPHGFDYEAWLLENGVRATGYVRSEQETQLLTAFVATPATLIERVRADIRERFDQRLEGRPYAGILTALAVGDQRAIQNEQWEWFRRTGINHLVSISGLHVTMVAGLVYALVSWLWRRQSALLLRLPAQRAAVLAGFVAALLYCLIAGFQVPAQRTLYMLAVIALALWRQRTTVASRVLSLALLLVLLLDPWAVLKPGFWLSFGAVGVLFYIGSNRLAAGHWLLEWGRAQWAVTVASVPVLLMLFQQFSLVSPLANALAIPAVSFIITPLALLATVPGLEWLLEPAYLATDGLMRFIGWLANLPWAAWQQHAPRPWTWLLALVGCLWLLLPRGFPARWLGVLTLLPLVLLSPQRPAPGAVRLLVLDVGQGLAVHVQTASHDLLYDSGPIYTATSNAGNRSIVPYLQAVGVNLLHGLIVSHQDSDHAGGAADVLEAVTTGWLMSSLPVGHELHGMARASLPCHAGLSWEWDGVHFAMLHPLAEQLRKRPRKTNDLSCVLMISTEAGRVLLTGDIEAVSERALLQRHAHGEHDAATDIASLQADVLLAPHHGSRTSSTPAFIQAVDAKDVIFPVGYRNRYRHPLPDIEARYRLTGARLHRTDLQGAVSIELPASKPSAHDKLRNASHHRSHINIDNERNRRPRYWYGR